MRRLALALCAAALAGPAAAPAWAAGDPARGAEKSLSCQACHGADGNSPAPTFPILAGQHEDYLLQSLLAYRDGRRTDPVMTALAAPLSAQDMADLAAYYARQKGLRPASAGWSKDAP